MNRYIKLFIVIVVAIIGYFTYLYIKEKTTDWGHKVVLCVPVYGQSLALGEEAVRITNFDSLKIKYNGRIVNENLSYQFGCYSDKNWKIHIKRFIHDHKRSFELSIYSMSEVLASKLGNDTIICIFPGGMGATPIWKFQKTGHIYARFLSDIENAYKQAKKRDWDFYLPAICWMQGESDIVDYTEGNYKEMLKQICTNINKDVKRITHQKNDIRFICYQPNCLSLAPKFDKNDYQCIETRVAQDFVDLIVDDTLFWASGPTYPYHFVEDRVHIDALGQQHIGFLEAEAVLNIIRRGDKTYGVIPQTVFSQNNDILIKFHVPYPPLVFDTISVKHIENYGFSVITKDGKNILSDISIEGDTIRLSCKQSPINSRVRYAVNGKKKRSGYEHGPRGNLRDSQHTSNWCYQFDKLFN